MNKIIKQLQAVFICITILFSLFAPVAVKAENAKKPKTTFPVQVIHKTGDDRENFVILIMGDGYTADQQEQFLEDATNKARGMLTWSPYKEYSDRINIYAMQVVSNESGVGEYGGKSPDTYFNMKVLGKALVFTNGGSDRAVALRNELEEQYLDEGANVGTIHILSNDSGSYGASVNSLFSFSTNSPDNSTGTVMAHEIAHSIGGLGDEYERYTNKPNTSDTTDPDSIKWSKMLGFRGIGITNAGTETAFAPSRECMMRWLGQPFCEVCKMELARKLNNTDYVSRPAAIYVADPEISLPHSRTGTLDRDSEKYRIDEKNITKANGDDLEFRTVVQNMVDREQHLKITFRILGADGTTVKYSKEKEYTVPALSNPYQPDEAEMSLSVEIPFVVDLVIGDKLDGKIIDMDTGAVLATDKTAGQRWSAVNIHYQLKTDDGVAEVPDTTTATVYVSENTAYTLRNPKLPGYTYIGNNVDQETIKVTGDSTDIIYYYKEEASGDVEQKTAECTTRPVCVTYDAKPHSFDIVPGTGVKLRYSMQESGAYTIEELPVYTDAGEYTIYYEAYSDSAESDYGKATLKIEKADTNLNLLATPQNIEGGGNVTLEVRTAGIPSGESVRVVCNDPDITLTKQPDDQWKATLPNETKTYTFTAFYDGNKNYAKSEAVCQVNVKEKKTQQENEPIVVPPNKPEDRSDIVVVVKPKINKFSRIENIDRTLKNKVAKAVSQGKKEGRKVSVKLKCNAKSRKSLTLKLNKVTINYLVKKQVKELQLDSGSVRVTMDLKTLKEIKKRMNSDVYLKLQKQDKSVLSSKAKKIVKNRPIYEISITGKKKQTISRLKNGKLYVEIPYKRSKSEKKNRLFAYHINKKGNAEKLSKSYYDAENKTIKFTTKNVSTFAVGYKK